VLKTIKNIPLTPNIQQLSLDIGEIDKGGYAHFMLKEIFEQPRSILDTFRGELLNRALKYVWEAYTISSPDWLSRSGSLLSVVELHGMQDWWGIPVRGSCRISVEVEYASEFRYRRPIINREDIVIAISQSGETADTLAAIRLAKEAGALVLGICNVVGSSIPRETDASIYTCRA